MVVERGGIMGLWNRIWNSKPPEGTEKGRKRGGARLIQGQH